MHYILKNMQRPVYQTHLILMVSGNLIVKDFYTCILKQRLFLTSGDNKYEFSQRNLLIYLQFSTILALFSLEKCHMILRMAFTYFKKLYLGLIEILH